MAWYILIEKEAQNSQQQLVNERSELPTQTCLIVSSVIIHSSNKQLIQLK